MRRTEAKNSDAGRESCGLQTSSQDHGRKGSSIARRYEAKARAQCGTQGGMGVRKSINLMRY
eukprot:6212071-Pleurochrysis_carterae.AAC.5